MMYIGIPYTGFDDALILDALAKNKALSSFGYLDLKIEEIKKCYHLYEKEMGDPWKLTDPLEMPIALSNALKAHYDGEIKGLEFISFVREKLRDDCCPICGSTLPPDEVDHIIPKHLYPEYAIFSRNLVPACTCNRKKGMVFKGDYSPQRVFHPYYDNAMEVRLVYLELTNGIEKPDIAIKVMKGHEQNETLRFHIDNILMKTVLLRFAENAWSKLSDLPRLTLRGFKKTTKSISASDLREEIEALVEESDHKHGTPNNWNSMFYFGVLQSPRHLGYIYQQLCAGR